MCGGEEVNTHGNNNGGGTINPNLMNQTGSLGRNPYLKEDYHQQQHDDSRDLEKKENEEDLIPHNRDGGYRLKVMKICERIKRRIIREGEMIFL